MSPNQILLRPEDAADALDLSRTTVFALIAAGELESVKIGRARRVPRDAIEAYVAKLRADQREGVA